MYAKNEKIYPAYISKYNSKHQKQVYYFNDSKQRWYYTAVKKLSLLLQGRTSKHNGDY